MLNRWSKKMMSFAAAGLMLAAGQAQAADWSVEQADNKIDFHPLSMILGRLNVEYERRLTPMVSLAVAPKVSLASVKSDDSDSTASSRIRSLSASYGAEVGARVYLSGSALRGLYLHPSVEYARLTDSDGDKGGEGSANLFAGHAKLGYQWMFANHLTINLGGGVMVAHGFAKSKSGDESGSATVLLPDLNFGLGAAF